LILIFAFVSFSYAFSFHCSFFVECVEDFVSENKRLKGLGIGAAEGPISLDDFRSLQRSNSVC